MDDETIIRKPKEVKSKNGRLIVSFSPKRAYNEKNREKGLKRLEKKLRSGKLTKEHINNRGYNKYLKLSGEMNIPLIMGNTKPMASGTD